MREPWHVVVVGQIGSNLPHLLSPPTTPTAVWRQKCQNFQIFLRQNCQMKNLLIVAKLLGCSREKIVQVTSSSDWWPLLSSPSSLLPNTMIFESDAEENVSAHCGQIIFTGSLCKYKACAMCLHGISQRLIVEMVEPANGRSGVRRHKQKPRMHRNITTSLFILLMLTY